LYGSAVFTSPVVGRIAFTFKRTRTSPIVTISRSGFRLLRSWLSFVVRVCTGLSRHACFGRADGVPERSVFFDTPQRYKRVPIRPVSRDTKITSDFLDKKRFTLKIIRFNGYRLRSSFPRRPYSVAYVVAILENSAANHFRSALLEILPFSFLFFTDRK